jgi:Pex2 / Pex12 amino terminal region
MNIFVSIGNQSPVRAQTVSDLSSILLYYSLTTLLDYQTLGEEYIGLVQVDNTLKALPSKLVMLQYLLDNIPSKIHSQLGSSDSHSPSSTWPTSFQSSNRSPK